MAELRDEEFNSLMATNRKNKKISNSDVLEIREKILLGRYLRDFGIDLSIATLAKKYGSSASAIRQASDNVTFKYLPDPDPVKVLKDFIGQIEKEIERLEKLET